MCYKNNLEVATSMVHSKPPMTSCLSTSSISTFSCVCVAFPQARRRIDRRSRPSSSLLFIYTYVSLQSHLIQPTVDIISAIDSRKHFAQQLLDPQILMQASNLPNQAINIIINQRETPLSHSSITSTLQPRITPTIYAGTFQSTLCPAPKPNASPSPPPSPPP